MEAVFEQVPQSGQFQFTLQVSATMNFSALAAQRIVSRFVADEVSYLLRAGKPTLVITEPIVWRVPVVLALPHYGTVAEVGHIDVNVNTGAHSITPEEIVQMRQNADDQATHYSVVTSSTP
ncbi:MAG: hypothetical protein Fur0021_37000 [Candidatus Promineifilaceae bacterium]